MDFAAKQVFFLFFAIHLPPVEEGEFLLYIMLNVSRETLEIVIKNKHEIEIS